MKKLFIIFILLIAGTVSAGTLYDYYLQKEGRFPGVKERAKVYENIFDEKYRGTAEQNIRLLSALNEDIPIGGFTSRGYSANFLSTATSGPMVVGSDVRILATTTANQRAYASICNTDGTNAVYLGLYNDRALTVGNGSTLNSSVYLQAKECYEIKPENMYEGSVRASSTVAASTLIIYEATLSDK